MPAKPFPLPGDAGTLSAFFVLLADSVVRQARRLTMAYSRARLLPHSPWVPREVLRSALLHALSIPTLRVGFALLFLVLVPVLLRAQVLPAGPGGGHAADQRRPQGLQPEKNYPFAKLHRFREFLQKYGNHPEANAARYGLSALSLLDGPERAHKDYAAAITELGPLAGNTAFPDHPFVLYHLGLANRGLGLKELALAAARPNEANQRRDAARGRFEEAGRHFAAASTAFSARIKNLSADAKDLPADLDWAARARCDLAEMLLRQRKPREARDAALPFTTDKLLARSRYKGLGLYYHGFASFQLGDTLAAGRSLSLLTPFTDPVYGTHARYLLARVHQNEGERHEALVGYEAAIAEHVKQQAAAREALKQPDRFKNDPEERARLEMLARDVPPDHIARATFFLGVLQYEDGRFAEALTRFQTFTKQFPDGPLSREATLRQGFCMVQLKQWADAQRTLIPLADKEPRLADQCLLWTGKAQIGSADPSNPGQYEQALRAGIDTLRRAAERANQLAANDPDAKVRRAEILFELADAQQQAKQYKEAAAGLTQLLNEKALPAREEELLERLVGALHLAGDYDGSDKVAERFKTTHPKSLLLPSVLFRMGENAWFALQAAEKNPNPQERTRETARLNEVVLQRYQVVVDKYPEFASVSLARYGLGMAYVRKGDIEKAAATLEAIPLADRSGDLAVVPYQLADLHLRQLPARADDAVAAGRLEEGLKKTVEFLDSFLASQPNGPQTPDALLKLGLCHQRLATLLAQPMEQQAELTAARTAFEGLAQRFPQSPLRPYAFFERAKVLNLAKDTNGAINELRRFRGEEPFRSSPVAPMALLQLATLLRAQNNFNEAVDVLAKVRQEQEANLLKDPARASWVPLLRYHHGVALREAGKRPEARAVFDLILKDTPDCPEAAEAALRSGQCLADDARVKVTAARQKLLNAGLKPEEIAATRKLLDEGVKETREAIAWFTARAAALQQKQPQAEPRARMLYEIAWAQRTLADLEVDTARTKARDELWQKRRDEVARRTPPGRQPPPVPVPELAAIDVPLQQAEKDTRTAYQVLIDAFPDLAINADSRFELAELLSERGEHDAAIKLLKEALDKEPGPELTDKVRLRLGAALVAKGDAKAALNQFNTVLQNPKGAQYAQAMYRAGECYLLLNQPAEAVQKLILFRDNGQYQNVPGVSDRALLSLGQALAVQKQWEPSRQAYETLCGRFGSSRWIPEARYGIGWSLQNQGRFDEAVASYQQVTNLSATELAARAQLQIGLCRIEQKRYPEASIALLVVPYTYDHPQLSAVAMLEAARALTLDKRTDQAVRLLETILRDHPNTEQSEAARKRLEELRKG